MNDKLTAPEEVAAVASGNTAFSERLFNILGKGNLIYSPFSASSAMAMVTAGAGGNTLGQLTQGMSFPDIDQLARGYQDLIPALRTNEKFTLEAANSIFVQAGFELLTVYQETVNKKFHASIELTDFNNAPEATRVINDWVKTTTRDKIQDLVNENMFNDFTNLVLVSAIYFKGNWKEKFDSKETKEQTFHLSDGRTKKVMMMRQTEKLPIAELNSLEAIMVEIPYSGDRLVLQILLPKERHGLRALEDKLMSANVEELFKSENSVRMVSLQLPRFKLEQTLPLTDLLKDLGMTDMFDESMADFSGIDGSKNLYVSTVIQKSFLEVNEEGSEAAAATVVSTECGSSWHEPETPEEFKADHPFLFYLKDKLTGMLLFAGRLDDPSI